MDAHQAIETLADVQRLLLPDEPQIRGLNYAFHYQPAAVAAGDYYDVMRLNYGIEPDFTETTQIDGWGVMIADVSGHGPAAAMEAVQFDAILRTYRNDEPPHGPAGALTYANRFFFSRRQRRHFLTVFAALYRPDLEQLVYCSAGHHPALLRRGNTVMLIDDGNDIPLGIDRDYRFSNLSRPMKANDLLVVFTDGLLEAEDSAGEAFGLDRLSDAVANADGHPSAVRDAVINALQAHQGSPLGLDDQSLLVLQPVVPGCANQTRRT
ncbi:PP2C family protein-serine/threonine phosphatase [Pseudomarimonas arenosa]|uniref:Serine/threonine-protein phosphatase n=1 Tax=Pseudomarimonas arenosa TaxID=2774145 RepID=A0AAW3ZR22_9GAMM|nr:PP2C family protein-serine/threonine phosphatase [Pseudomarimonas arenosa]MBD8526721.1 serine/threonine-protein phosphatase [Pseudomarimonas arenosa]